MIMEIDTHLKKMLKIVMYGYNFVEYMGHHRVSYLVAAHFLPRPTFTGRGRKCAATNVSVSLLSKLLNKLRSRAADKPSSGRAVADAWALGVCHNPEQDLQNQARAPRPDHTPHPPDRAYRISVLACWVLLQLCPVNT